MELSRQEYWTGLPFPSPGNLLDPEIKLESSVSPALTRRFFNIESPENVLDNISNYVRKIKRSKRKTNSHKLL